MSKRDIESLLGRNWVASSDEALKLAVTCGWVEVSAPPAFSVSKRGEEIRSQENYQTRLRVQLEDFIGRYKPSWSKLLPGGRTQTLMCLNKDVFQCFKEAGLTEKPPSKSIVSWWDRLASRARGQRDAMLLEVGRAGELLSINYETSRVGSAPKWQAIESNADGYDLLSYVSRADNTRLSIEVKSSTQAIDRASFHLSKREWRHASSTPNYHLHLWAQVEDQPQLAVLEAADLLIHIPKDVGSGEWTSSAIPFATFKKHFEKN
tara:strand:+ start:21104 stop:21892 length:789 start_codon:yes stop_codon:yes gene_type:complete